MGRGDLLPPVKAPLGREGERRRRQERSCGRISLRCSSSAPIEMAHGATLSLLHASLLLPFDILFAAVSQCDPRGLLSLASSGLWPLSRWTSVGHLQLTQRISSEPLGTTFSVKLAPPSRAALTGLSSSGHFLGTTPLRLVLLQLGFHTSVVSGLDPVGCKQVQTQLCSYSAAPHGTCQSWALTGSLWNR